MIANPQFSHITPEEYLAMEEKSDIKHEYIDGYAYAMAGANDPHVTITLNIASIIRSHLRGTGCRVYITDMKAQIDSLRRFYYPDVMVTCDPRDTQTPNYKSFPKLIIEVLSSSTEAFDRGDKFADYQQLESLEEYVLANTKRRRLDCFQRNEAGLWVLKSYSDMHDNFQLSSINFEGKFVDLYEDVTFLDERR
ncbi:Uma2 family endonuclease [Tumidithrix elongata RA019]|uniref:Uma2 family endonuclease n=1 Tax=Tumidithrix elongata BACA0141 TaxID=2716417 RepID=A0AAW9Q025_9CYAN|nr:Uma2 family endonuclease [Tumidithrix elongata RA019]